MLAYNDGGSWIIHDDFVVWVIIVLKSEVINVERRGDVEFGTGAVTTRLNLLKYLLLTVKENYVRPYQPVTVAARSEA
jgi:hypothetical protein